MSNDIVEIKWESTSPAYREPIKLHECDAGWDLKSDCGSGPLFPAIRYSIGTGVKAAIPKGYFGQIVGRSSMALKGLMVFTGTVDSGYRGEIRVVIQNISMAPVDVKCGDRIAQLLILPVPDVKWVEVKKLEETDRGANGFGSTGR